MQNWFRHKTLQNALLKGIEIIIYFHAFSNKRLGDQTPPLSNLKLTKKQQQQQQKQKTKNENKQTK